MVILISAARHSRSTRAGTSRRKDESRLPSRFPVSLFDAYYCNELMETRQVKRRLRTSAIAGGILAATTLGLACLRCMNTRTDSKSPTLNKECPYRDCRSYAVVASRGDAGLFWARPCHTNKVKIKSTDCRDDGKSLLDYVTRRFNASSAKLKSLWGCTFAETPLNAISRSNWSPKSAEARPLLQSAP